MEQSRSTHYRPHGRQEVRSGVTRKVLQGLLAAMLFATAAMPAFAGKPDRERQREHHAQQQAQDVSAAGKRSGKRRTVTKTFANGSTIAIPSDADEKFGPADPYPSSIGVSGFKKGKITDLNLTLRGFSHTFAPDVGVLLVAPNGGNAIVMDAVGNVAQDSDLTFTLDDEAANPLPDADGLTSGSFRPRDAGRPGIDGSNLVAFPAPAPTPSGDTALSTFDGANPNGQWQLFVIDASGGDVGDFANGWTLEITAKTKKAKKRKH